VTAISAILNALTVRYGDTVLLRLPGWLPLLGGPVTLEALVFGALNGLTLAGLFVAFVVAQRLLPTSALIGLIPRAFYPLAVVAAIAITFVPTTLRQARQIRDAQAIRGHRLVRMRDWLPLLLPLLIGGLERAFQLAEAMAARGFASAGRPQHATALRASMVAGLAALLAGWLLVLAWGQQLAGRALMLIGGGLLVGALWLAGRRAPRTRYRRTFWAAGDTAVLIGAAVSIVAFTLPLPGIDRAVLAYYPYPLLRLPPFDPVLGFATLGLAWPAAVLRGAH
jgi:energy-coupling factor transport system permease protein